MYIRTYLDEAKERQSYRPRQSMDEMAMDHIMMGGGLLSKLNNKMGSFLFKKWRPTPPDPTGMYAGQTEKHYPYHNYCGPGTYLKLRMQRGDQPVDYPDSLAYAHDVDYQNISDGILQGKYNDDDIKRLVRESDQRLIEGLGKDKNMSSMLRSFIVQKIMQSKTKLEDIKLMNAKSFVNPTTQQAQKYAEEQSAAAPPAMPFGNFLKFPIAPPAPTMQATQEVNQPIMDANPTVIQDQQQGAGVAQAMIPHEIVTHLKKDKHYPCCKSCSTKSKFGCEKKPAHLLRKSMLK